MQNRSLSCQFKPVTWVIAAWFAWPLTGKAKLYMRTIAAVISAIRNQLQEFNIEAEVVNAQWVQWWHALKCHWRQAASKVTGIAKDSGSVAIHGIGACGRSHSR